MFVDLNSLDQSHIQPESSFLSLLEQNDIPIRSSCRNGMCGECKCQLPNGIKTSKGKGSLRNLAENEFLACKAKAVNFIASKIQSVQVVNHFSFS